MGKVKLWISPGTCSLLPHILLRESGLEFDLETVDVTKPTADPEYKRINPKGRLPILVLEDGTTILTETAAISTWIMQMVPDKHLFGKTNLEICRVYEWFNWLSGTVHERGFGTVFRPSQSVGIESAYASVREKSWQWIKDCYQLIEDHLQSVHSVGDDFTAADVFLYVVYRWGYLFQWDMASLYPKYTKLVEEVAKRQSVVDCTRIEGIPLIKDNRVPAEFWKNPPG